MVRNISQKFVIVFAFLLAMGAIYALYEPYGAMWDEHVYTHEARHIASDGDHGFVETLRPLGLPVVLSSIGATDIESARLINSLIGLAMLLAFFRALQTIGIDPDRAAAITVITAFVPTMFEAMSGVCAMPLAFFAACVSIATYNNDYWPWVVLSGAAAAFSFQTRAIYGAWLLAGVILPFIEIPITKKYDEIASRLAAFSFGAAGILILFAGLHYRLFSDIAVQQGYPRMLSIIYPMYQQILDHASSYLWVNQHGAMFYLRHIYSITPLLILAPLSSESFLNRLDREHWYVVASVGIIAAFLFITPHKEIRYLRALLPWVVAGAYMAGYRLLETALTPTKTVAAMATVIIFGATMMPAVYEHVALEVPWHEEEAAKQDQINTNMPFYEDDDVLLGTPVVESDADLVVGYYNDEFFLDKLVENRYDGVVYDPDAFPCQENNSECLSRRQTIQGTLEEQYWEYTSVDNTTVYTDEEIIAAAGQNDTRPSLS
jgi:hypothetical protein